MGELAARLTAFLDRHVYGERHAAGETDDGLAWDVRPHPRTGRWRVSVSVPWAECPARIGDRYDSEAGDGERVVLGRFCEAGDPAAMLAEVRGWRVAKGAAG